jgi:NADH-quinone oxidoreductase subunit C
MNQESIGEKLVATFEEETIEETVLLQDQATVTVSAEAIVAVCRFLKEDPELAFDFLSFVGGVDRYPATPRFELVYQLYSLKHNHRFRVKARVDESEENPPSIDSVVEVWPTANWHERETAEMFGITFNNHPDPRKLLLPDNWTAHPLRKDFPLEGTDEDTPDLPREQG